MERVIVSLILDGAAPARDLDMPTDLAASQLAPQLAAALGLPPDVAYALELVATGQRLRPDETLAAAQVWDGEQLRLRGLAVAPAAAMAAGAPPPAAPLAGASEPAHPAIVWRALDLPAAPAAPTAPAPDDDGYVWKPLSDPA